MTLRLVILVVAGLALGGCAFLGKISNGLRCEAESHWPKNVRPLNPPSPAECRYWLAP